MKLLIEKWPGWVEPERVFEEMSTEKSVVFLDSHSQYGADGRWSVIALHPYAQLRAWPDQTEINGQPVRKSPLSAIKSMLETYRLTDCIYERQSGDEADCASWQALHLPIMGGCMGAFAYESGLPLAGLDVRAADHCPWPWISFDFYDQLILFDLEKKHIYLQVCGMLMHHASGMQLLKQRLEQIDPEKADITSEPVRQRSSSETIQPAKLESVSGPVSGEAGGQPPSVHAASSRPEARLLSMPRQDAYMQKIEQLREWIAQGDVYIANFTGQIKYETARDSVSLYRRMRALNPAPFAAFMRQGDCEWMSSSPERFLQIRKTRPERMQSDMSRSDSKPNDETRTAAASPSFMLETKPIKGTRPRGRDQAEDEAEKRQLANSDKDRSELLMIVDLERNDISRVCLPASVRVTSLFDLETYPTVHHLVATVRGELRPDCDAADAVAVCFPGGSITGAPKMRAMELIRDLEQQPRGYYTGCLGYFSADGQADFSILIRTMFRWQNGPVCYGAGGGITWESDPASEYQEMLDKAAAFIRLMQQ